MSTVEEIQNLYIPSFTKAYHTEPYDAISPTRPELSMKGKSVVVTGGGTGIGKATAKAFAQADAAAVAILGRREDRLKEAIAEITDVIGGSKCKLLYEVADVVKLDVTKKAMDNIVQKQGQKIDIVVCNAGSLNDLGKVLDYDVDKWMEAFDFNVRIPLNTLRAIMPHAAKDVTILNISSGVAHIKPISGFSSYAASKTAGVKLMDHVQKEYPDFRVVNIQPGAVDTEMSRQGGGSGTDSPDLAGGFCVWLASPEASFLKGKYVWANWDVEEMKARAEEIESSHLLSIRLDGLVM